MLYIHQSTCISPQQTFLDVDINSLYDCTDNKLKVIEPGYEGIPPGILRRMGKAVRIGVGAALPLIKEAASLDGFIIGTANGGMEDCIKFLNQIIQYEEGVLTPGSFVQSTPNAIAGQLGLFTKNKGYNITHVHRGLAFENAVIDAMMLLHDHPENNYLVGAVDEISAYNYNIELLSGAYKKEPVSCKELYTIHSEGCIAGESAVTFLVNGNKTNAVAQLLGVHGLHTTDIAVVEKQLQLFIQKHLPAGEKIDLLLSGENGDNRLSKYYTSVENIINTATARFKHMTGEYATVSSFAVWLACQLFQTQDVPSHMLKTQKPQAPIKNILIYNNYKGAQHSFILLTKEN
ncbi:MAG TPA: beta-ketoacyl synthase chain length factor [Ferruginibacter sp.]|nr:beta-ketoacyl synthase chain length factor [Ferruginibacter sp.]